MASELRPAPPGVPNIDNALLQDIYRYMGKEYPNNLFAYSMNGDTEGDPGIETITWERLLEDSQRVAGYLTSLSPETGGKVVALLADSDYTYFTYIIGVWLNGWAVKEFVEHFSHVY